VNVNRLRKKIEKDSKNPRYLQTVRGKGYMLLPE
jgi:two-component system phosphate regulon response regulator OmpR